MIISRNLLAEFYPQIKEISFEELSKAFFKSGIEIEGYEEIVCPNNLFYGLIESVEKVEGSDKLNLCQVNIPVKKKVFSIVCGASNVRVGLRVLAALPGAKLANGTIEIKERTFESWGITSYGMLCSYTELYKSNLLKEISEFEKGKIIELGSKWKIDKEFSPEDFWLNDLVLDLSIPANRNDLHSAWGLSRELAKVFNKTNKKLKHGGNYTENQDPWALKRVLLVNNIKEVDSTDFNKNLNQYLYLAFNEVMEGGKFNIRNKSSYFQELKDSFVSKKPLDKFNLKKVEVDEKEILSFLGLEEKWSYKGDFFVFNNGYAAFPEWREDINTIRDIVDEIVILVGWENIPSLPIVNTKQNLDKNNLILAIEKIREFWRNYGFFECTSFNLHKSNPSEISVSNPLSNDHVSLRSHALYELIDVLKRNYQEKKELLPVFEIFETQGNNPQWTLNIVVPEKREFFPLNETKYSFDFYDLQALLRKSFRYLNINPWFNPSEEVIAPFLNINYLNISDIGFLGHLDSPIPIPLIGLACELKLGEEKETKLSTPIKYPPSYKDISIEINKDSEVYIGDVIKSLRSKDLISSKLIEKYVTEEGISYLIRVKLQANKTLTGEDIKDNMNELYKELNKVKGLKIR